MAVAETQLLKKGLREFYRGRFSRAEQNFRSAADAFLGSEKYSHYFESAGYLIRSHVERDIDRLSNVEHKSCEVYENVRQNVRRLLQQSDLSVADQSRAHFVLSLLDLAEGHIPQAEVELHQALDEAETSQDPLVLTEPLYGLAYCALKKGNIDLALSYMDRLKHLLSLKPNPKYAVKSLLLGAEIYLRKGDYDQGLKCAWRAYRELLHVPNFVVYIHTLNYLAQLYMAKNDHLGARHYLELAQQALVGSELRRVSTYVNETLKNLNDDKSFEGYELRYEVARGVLTNRNGRTLDFAGQFVMQDLLKLFAESPDRAFSKEEIVRHVWGETYDPASHNNKLYVTIRRLRRMLQQMDLTVPNTKLIVRSKDGYRLDPEVHLQLR